MFEEQSKSQKDFSCGPLASPASVAPPFTSLNLCQYCGSCPTFHVIEFMPVLWELPHLSRHWIYASIVGAAPPFTSWNLCQYCGSCSTFHILEFMPVLWELLHLSHPGIYASIVGAAPPFTSWNLCQYCGSCANMAQTQLDNSVSGGKILDWRKSVACYEHWL